MGCSMTENNRTAPFRLFPVTEIHRSPYRGRLVSAVSVRKEV
jgi:hypothetical protein